MRREDIARFELGTVLRHTLTRRIAVLVARSPEIGNFAVHYLDGDRELMEGCAPEKFEKTTLQSGTFLREYATGLRAILLKDSAGPRITIKFIIDGETVEMTLCEPAARYWKAAFAIVQPPEGTVARTAAP